MSNSTADGTRAKAVALLGSSSFRAFGIMASSHGISPVTPPKTAPKAGFVVPAKTGPKTGPTVVPPRKVGTAPGPSDMPPPKTVPPARKTPGEILAEMNEKVQTEEPKARGPDGRGARPERPSQQRRETGRSFERLAEKLSDKTEALATCQAELNICQHNLDAAVAQQKALETRNGELQKVNDNLSAQYQGNAPGHAAAFAEQPRVAVVEDCLVQLRGSADEAAEPAGGPVRPARQAARDHDPRGEAER